MVAEVSTFMSCNGNTQNPPAVESLDRAGASAEWMESSGGVSAMDSRIATVITGAFAALSEL